MLTLLHVNIALELSSTLKGVYKFIWKTIAWMRESINLMSRQTLVDIVSSYVIFYKCINWCLEHV